MGERLSLCCFRCDLCLALRENAQQEDPDRSSPTAGSVASAPGFHPEEISCDGCTANPDDRPLDSGCPVRPCVVSHGLANCAECGDYPCDRIRDRLITFEELTAGKQVSEKDREDFIRPYENRARIDSLRGTNRPD